MTAAGVILLTAQVLPAVVHDGVEAVRNGEDCTIIKLSTNGGLDQLVCLQVNSCCGFIQNQDPGLPQQSSGQTQQLSLTETTENTSELHDF